MSPSEARASITVTPVRVAEDERMPVYVHVVDHPDARVLVDTGMTELHPPSPIYVRRRELDDARSADDHTIREWVDAPGVRYVPVEGEHELLPRAGVACAEHEPWRLRTG